MAQNRKRRKSAKRTRSTSRGTPTRASRHKQAAATDKEVEQLRAVTQTNPTSVDAWCALAEALGGRGEFSEAGTAYERAIDCAPRTTSAHSDYGRLLMTIGDNHGAEARLRKAIDIDPACLAAFTDLSWVLRRLGRTEEAVAAGRTAMRDSTDPNTLYYLAFALLANDEPQEALSVCNLMLQVDPCDARALALKVTALDGVGQRDAGRELASFEHLIGVVEISTPPGFDSLADFNRALVEQVLRFPGRPGDDTQTVDLFADPDPASAALGAQIDEIISEYLSALPAHGSHPFLANKPKRWTLDGWGTRLLQTPAHEHHFHQHGWVSGVYYARLPSFVGTESAGVSGCLEFCRFQQYGERDVQSELMVLPPKEGMMVIFPSYFYHRVCPFEDARHRVSIAFNAALN